uniref:Uncharacterized protein n=1 Tax=Anguilla anguilla TaxID=7936 RepID=A0A0E9TVT7_ANGAN
MLTNTSSMSPPRVLPAFLARTFREIFSSFSRSRGPATYICPVFL